MSIIRNGNVTLPILGKGRDAYIYLEEGIGTQDPWIMCGTFLSQSEIFIEFKYNGISMK